MALTLTAKVGDDPLEADVTGSMPVAGTARVTLLAVSDPADTAMTEVMWTRDGKDWTVDAGDKGIDIDDQAATGTVSRTFTAAGNFVEFGVTATVAGASSSATLTLVEKSADDGAGKDPGPADGAITEVDIGEMDPGFAYFGGVFTAVLVALLAIGMWLTLRGIALPAESTTLGPGQVLSGGYGERVSSIVLVLAAFTGIILLVVGAYLAALETRGRLRTVKVTQPDDGDRGPLGDTSDLVVKGLQVVVENLRFMRGTVAVLLTGLLLLGIAMWASVSLASPTVVSPAPAPTSTGTTASSTAAVPSGTAPASVTGTPSVTMTDSPSRTRPGRSRCARP